MSLKSETYRTNQCLSLMVKVWSLPLESHKTFGDLANIFIETVLQSGAQFQQIDVHCDCLHKHSIKIGTWKPNGNSNNQETSWELERFASLCKLGELHCSWGQQGRPCFLHLNHRSPANQTIDAAGGFSDDERVEASDTTLDTDSLPLPPVPDTCA